MIFQFLMTRDLLRITSNSDNRFNRTAIVEISIFDMTMLEKNAPRMSLRRSSEDCPNLGSEYDISALLIMASTSISVEGFLTVEYPAIITCAEFKSDLISPKEFRTTVILSLASIE